jgi:hypothetical protein
MNGEEIIRQEVALTDLIQQGNNLAQNVFVKLQDCVRIAGQGDCAHDTWEEAQQYQSQLLGTIDAIWRQAKKLKDLRSTERWIEANL